MAAIETYKYRLLVRYKCGHLTDGDARQVSADAREAEARRVVRAAFPCPACCDLGVR